MTSFAYHTHTCTPIDNGYHLVLNFDEKKNLIQISSGKAKKNLPKFLSKKFKKNQFNKKISNFQHPTATFTITNWTNRKIQTTENY